jgi:hypothetical protein
MKRSEDADDVSWITGKGSRRETASIVSFGSSLTPLVKSNVNDVNAAHSRDL